MQLIPAIDLRGGKCVRLFKGEREKETVYSTNPVEVALKWQSEGAARLHLVDLDGAFEGRPVNTSVISAITSSLNIPLQLGGGMRDAENVRRALELGVSKVILGTAAVEKPEMVKELVDRYQDRIIVGIDARDGIVAVKGWVEGSEKRAVDFALEMQDLGVREIIYTDISRDGTLEGPNYSAMEEMAKALDIPLIASGGVSSLEDLRLLRRLEHLGITGVIVGQALYSGKFTLKEALMEFE
ncbi:MAG: 1-(5-phosphoribosyl)-5-[(5-phosphoribosylamino)methylideneamino]imidazole-4-carboxamide isomerase [Firmicutes bacterium]|jgi:phosphoribosylformimino-5-aminoimidazole carboxamide ribotide isomerase|nr:1-(5-phosphoribosyl)-5-[(5-phosphoribosylamino)methylideneamino]imidazole-4-carboxamide isomerase [Bacillota bacterium]